MDNGFTNIEDWRRNNTDLLIFQISEAIKKTKPHVKFGISPFGVWKNYSTETPDGSRIPKQDKLLMDIYTPIHAIGYNKVG